MTLKKSIQKAHAALALVAKRLLHYEPYFRTIICWRAASHERLERGRTSRRKGERFFEQRKWNDALRELKLATQVNPYNSSWFFNMGLILDEMGRFEEAAEAYQEATRIDPHDLSTLNHLGVAQFRVGRHDQAVATFKQIESIDATYEPAYCNRIIVYAQLGQHELAEEMFYTARLYKEHCPHCFYNMGCSLEARGLYDKAIFCWTRALDLQGGQGDVYVRIGHALWKKRELEQARRSFLTDLRLNPGRTRTFLDLGELLIEMGRGRGGRREIPAPIELRRTKPGDIIISVVCCCATGGKTRRRTASSAFWSWIRLMSGPILALGRIYYTRHRIGRSRGGSCGRNCSSDRKIPVSCWNWEICSWTAGKAGRRWFA